MYLHLGQNVVVRLADVIGIFDLENATLEKDTRNFLANATKHGRVVNVSPEMPKSFILCRDREGRETVYIAQISPKTLKKRTGFVGSLSLEP